MYKLRLYYIENTESENEIAHFKQVLENKLPGKWSLETINVLEEPELAAQNDIFATPTLVRDMPEPAKKLILDLSKLDDIFLSITV